MWRFLFHSEPTNIPIAEIIAPATIIPKSGAFSLLKAMLFAILNVPYSASIYITPKKRVNAHFPFPQKLFLPITYDTGWNGVNNGETQGINRVFNTYMSLDLKEGTNEIELTFIPAKMKLGIELSIATLVIILVYTFCINKLIRKDGILDKIIVNLGFGIYIIITVGFYFKVYLMCIIQTIKQWIG
mgnify:FL=1